MKDAESHFGFVFRSLRHQCGATLKETASALDISVPYLSDIERGKRSGAPLLERLSKVRAMMALTKRDEESLHTAEWMDRIQDLSPESMLGLQRAVEALLG